MRVSSRSVVCAVTLSIGLLLLAGRSVSANTAATSATTATTAASTSAVSTQTTSPAIVLPTMQPTTVAQRDAFLGTYKAVEGCVPSATCCCSTSPVTITAGVAADALAMAGTTDGGAGCLGQTALSGAMQLDQPLHAFQYISFVPVLFSLESDPTHEWLQMTTTKTDCAIVFQRVPNVAEAASNVASTVVGAISNPSTIPSAITSATGQLPASTVAALPTGTTTVGSVLSPVGIANPASVTQNPISPAQATAASVAPVATTTTAPVATTAAATVPQTNAQGQLILPATTLGSGSNAFTLPATTLANPGSMSPGLPMAQQQQQSIGSAAVPTAQQTSVTQPTAAQTQPIVTQPILTGGSSMASPFGQLQQPQFPAIGSGLPQFGGGVVQQQQSGAVGTVNVQGGFPQINPSNPFGNTQNAAIAPVSTSIPFGSTISLPQPGSAPFQINALQAVQIDPATGQPINSQPSSQLSTPQLPGIGGGNVGAATSSSPLPSGSVAQPSASTSLPTGSPVLPSGSLPSGSTSPFGSASLPTGSSPLPTGAPAAAAGPGSVSTAAQLTATQPTGTQPIGTQPGSVGTSTLPAPIGSGSSPLPAVGGPVPSPASQGSFTTATASGLTYTQQLLEMADSGAPAGTKNYLASFVVPASEQLPIVILHYYTSSDMRTKNVNVNSTSSSALVQQLMTTAGSALAPGNQYRFFTHGPINVAADDTLTYFYTFSRSADGKGAANTQSYAYPSTAQPSVAAVRVPQDAALQMGMSPVIVSTAPVSIGGDSTSTVPSSQQSPIDTTSIWNGQFEADSSCVPSETCCCGVGTMNVSSTVASPNEVLLSGMLDGGAGCLYQTSLTGLMAVNASNTQQASRSIQIPNEEQTVIVFVAELSTPTSTGASSTAAPNSQLTIFNSFRSCRTTAMKTSSYNPSTVPSSVDITPAVDPNEFSSNATHSSMLPRDAFVGDYEFDQTCVPSEACCCAVGSLRIDPVYEHTIAPTPIGPMAAAMSTAVANASATNTSEQVIFSANLDGGAACVGMKNVSQIFSLTSPRTASFSFPPVSLQAKLGSSAAGAGLDTVTFTNSMYPTCVSSARKQSNIAPVSIIHGNSSVHNMTDPTSVPPVVSSDPNSTESLPALASLRDSLIGDYVPSGCTPSPNCCCPSGTSTVRANASSPTQLDVDTVLAGQGFACLQKDGPVHMTFAMINSTVAEATPFPGVNAKFTATLNNGTQTIMLTNSVHPQCPTTFTRVASTSGAVGGLTIMHRPMAVLLATAVVFAVRR